MTKWFRDSANYRRVNSIDLTAALDRSEVEPAGTAVKAILVRRLVHAGTGTAELHFGRNADGVVVRQGSIVRMPGDAIATGVLISCAAGGGAGALADLVFLYDDADQRGPAFEVIDP